MHRLTFSYFSPRVQQPHLLADRFLNARALVPNLLHRHRQDALDPRHDGTRGGLLNPGLLDLPLHHIFPQVEARIQGSVVKGFEESESPRRRTRQERPQKGIGLARGRPEHKREPKES